MSLKRAFFTNFAVPSCITKWASSAQAHPEAGKEEHGIRVSVRCPQGLPGSSCCTREMWGFSNLWCHICLPQKYIWDMPTSKPPPALAVWVPLPSAWWVWAWTYKEIVNACFEELDGEERQECVRFCLGAFDPVPCKRGTGWCSCLGP